MKKLRILIADDSHFMRIAYKKILETQEAFDVIALAADGEQALRQAIQLAPDVAILDIRMPKLSGIEAARRIIDHHPGTAIVIISAYEDLVYLAELVKHGPERKAYLLKSSLDDIGKLIHAVKVVTEGQTVLDPIMAHKLASLYSRQSHWIAALLTEEEQNILELMAEGYEESAIAVYHHLESGALEAHLESMYRKLGLKERNGHDPRILAVQVFVGQITDLISHFVNDSDDAPFHNGRTL